MNSTQAGINQTHSPMLALAGNNGYDIQGDRVVITASAIANNRDANNLSGTVSIELWALEQAYQGGEFHGQALAGTRIGEIQGQHFLADCRYDLLFNEPTAGNWNMVLMLREWTDAGFVTRDYVNFAKRYVVARKQAAVQAKTDNVISVSFAGKETAAEARPVEAEQPKAAKVKKPADQAADDKRLSINSASLDELAALKGVSLKVAKAIVQARPFTALEDMLPIKGIGPKLLNNLRKVIKV